MSNFFRTRSRSGAHSCPLLVLVLHLPLILHCLTILDPLCFRHRLMESSTRRATVRSAALQTGDSCSFFPRSSVSFGGDALSVTDILFEYRSDGDVVLASVCIPSSVRVIRAKCFQMCHALSGLAFESGSTLRHIEELAFWECSSLLSICIPSSAEIIGRNVSSLVWRSRP